MKLNLAYAKTQMTLELADKNLLAVLEPNPVEDDGSSPDGGELVRKALTEPIGSPRLKDIIKPGEKIVIITSDITRPIPSYIVLPPLLQELSDIGVKSGDIIIVFALGNHRAQTVQEKARLVGDEIFAKYRCIDSDPCNTVNLGTTSYGTPVDVFKPVVEADRRICLGNIEYHYFAGYSGGAKAIMPGVSTKQAIQANHGRMVCNEACAGRIEDNPIRQDIDEVATIIPIDFIVNVVLNEKKQIVRAFAGHYIEAHREGCRFLDSMYKVSIPKLADIVVASPGGYPKDINLYQAQKALDNAKHAVREGGIIILAADCSEGYGEDVFERWIENYRTPRCMIDEINCNFELGGHKAAAIALVCERCSVYIVSGLSDEMAQMIFMKPFASLQAAYDAALGLFGQAASVIVMPYAGSTLPLLSKT